MMVLASILIGSDGLNGERKRGSARRGLVETSNDENGKGDWKAVRKTRKRGGRKIKKKYGEKERCVALSTNTLWLFFFAMTVYLSNVGY